MPKPLILQLEGTDLPLQLDRVERSDLYGFVEIEALDAKGRKCHSASLADDGQTIVGPGGSSFASLAPDGSWLDKSKLKAVNPQGEPITPVPSSFSAPIPLAKTATIDEYLTYNIRSVYLLTGSEVANIDALTKKLQTGTIFTFPYSYRGGLEPDTAFLLLSIHTGTPFLAIGNPTKLEFIGFDQPAATDETQDTESEDLDFSMM